MIAQVSFEQAPKMVPMQAALSERSLDAAEMYVGAAVCAPDVVERRSEART
jgi:hypothetical protein